MFKCTRCRTIVLAGGVAGANGRYCGEDCYRAAEYEVVSARIPEELVREHAAAMHAGPCPKCGRAGPVDVHTTCFVWSALVVYGVREQGAVTCRECAKTRLWGAIFGTSLLGWWSLHGMLFTPIVLVRNFVALGSGRKASEPSQALLSVVRAQLAHELRDIERSEGTDRVAWAAKEQRAIPTANATREV